MKQTNMLSQGFLLAMLAVYGGSGALAQPASFWQRYAPGELLRNLDLMTLNEEWQPTTPAVLPPELSNVQLSKRIDDADSLAAPDDDDDDVDDEEDNVDAGEHGGDNYDQAYETFVRKYFAKALAASEESLERDIEPLSAPLQVKLPAGKAKKNKQKNCKEVEENKHSCTICKNPKTGEHSKTCSYQQQAGLPHRYAYEKGSKYKKLKDASYKEETDDDVAAEEEDEAEADGEGDAAAVESAEYNDSLEAPAVKKPKVEAHVRRNDNKQHSNSSSCVKKPAGQHKICYHCKSSEGEQYMKCFAAYGKPIAKPTAASSTTTKAPSVAAKKQRIYKRTVSYIYEHSSNGTVTDDATDISALGKPKEKRKLIVKILKKKLQN